MFGSMRSLGAFPVLRLCPSAGVLCGPVPGEGQQSDGAGESADVPTVSMATLKVCCCLFP